MLIYASSNIGYIPYTFKKPICVGRKIEYLVRFATDVGKESKLYIESFTLCGAYGVASVLYYVVIGLNGLPQVIPMRGGNSGIVCCDFSLLRV